MTPVKNCINLTYDSRGYYYEIPNYCVNDPHKFEIISASQFKSKPVKSSLQIIVRKVVEEKSYTLSNYSTIKDLKEEVAKTFPFNDHNAVKDNNGNSSRITANRIRFFYGGKELKDEDELWVYDIRNESIIQMMIKMV